MNIPESTPRRKAGLSFRRLPAPKTDMTPMVDLAFLLITFFILTASLNEPKTFDLFMPADGPPTDAAESLSLTVLLEKDNSISWYEGGMEEALTNNKLQKANYSPAGLRKIIQEKQLTLKALNKDAGEMVVLIKPGKESTYKNVVDVLDEMLISRVKKYAVVKQEDQEITYLALNETALNPPNY